MSITDRVRRWWSARGADREAGDVDALRDQLDAAHRQHSAGLAQVRRGVADVATSRKRIEVRLAGLRSQLQALDAEAKAAVDRGDDDGARTALSRRLTLEKAAAELVSRHEEFVDEEQRLVDSARRLENQIEDFRLKKDTLTARYSAASARAEINAATSGIATASSQVGQAMEEAERHTRELEATAAAVDELIAEGVIAAPGEDEDDALARRIDAALAEAPSDTQRSDTQHLEGGDDGSHQISQ